VLRRCGDLETSRMGAPYIYDISHLRVKYFKYLGSTITNDARRTRKINYGIAIAKAAVYKKKTFGTSKLDLNLSEKLAKCYTLSTALYGAEN